MWLRGHQSIYKTLNPGNLSEMRDDHLEPTLKIVKPEAGVQLIQIGVNSDAWWVQSPELMPVFQDLIHYCFNVNFSILYCSKKKNVKWIYWGYLQW